MITGIDDAHCELIYGLAVSLKPRSILELGYGEGASARALWRAMRFNQQRCLYTLVDDWRGYGGKPPNWIAATLAKPDEWVILSMTEAEFYQSPLSVEPYDLILSDADHEHADQWFDQSLAMLRAPGLLIYHDVCHHPNLGTLIQRATAANLSHLVFNRSSFQGEQCERGLLVISKI